MTRHINMILLLFLIPTALSLSGQTAFHYFPAASENECAISAVCPAMGRQPCGAADECGPCINGFTPMSSDPRICRRVKARELVESTDIVSSVQNIPERKRASEGNFGDPVAMSLRAAGGSPGGLHAAATKHTITFIVLVAFAISGIVLIGSLGLAYHKFQKKELKLTRGSPEVSYGVGGNDDGTDEKELARKTQIYHYQHQKRIISSMENRGRSVDEEKVVHAVAPPPPGSLARSGSYPGSPASGSARVATATDAPDSEEELDPDFTVYECPGLAPSGEMEVKNPLFGDDEEPITTDEE